MDDGVRRKARTRHGVVLSDELGDHPGRAARRDELTEVHPRAWVATTQPVDVRVLLSAVSCADGHREWVVMEEAALWVYGLIPLPEELVIGVASTRRLATRPPVRTRRVVESVLRAARWQHGCRVVALEVALLQGAARRDDAATRELVEAAVRDRRTTLTRLRARCRRGLKGSARLRRVCDELAGGSIDREVRRLKAALEERGVSGLQTEVRFENLEGASAYGDLVHLPTLTVIEVDGYVTHAQRDRFRTDRRRDRWMRAVHKVTTLRVDVSEIREDVDALADELVVFLLPDSDARSA